jgi:Phospholipase_D-nuclease N-terminal
MLFFDGGFALLFILLWIFCIIDVITTPDGAHRNLPKLAWLILVILLMDVGSIAWLLAGKPWAGLQKGGLQQGGLPHKANTGRPGATAYVEADRPRRAVATNPVATNPDDDEEFLAGLRARAEEQRRRARDAAPAKEQQKPAADEDGPTTH